MSATLAPGPVDVPGWDAVVDAGLTRGDAFGDRAAEHAALRRVAADDLGVGRVLDGHRNALERLLAHRPHEVADEDRRAAADGLVPHGVWGADPGPGDLSPPADGDEPGGPPPDPGARGGRPGTTDRPATLDVDGGTVSGVKVFCSGAGLVQRALVLVRGREGSSTCVLLDVSDPARAAVDRAWFAGDALRTSASHRVVLDRVPVLATLTGDGPRSALLEEPWFSGDALRTAVTWAGAVDAVLGGTVAALRGRGASDAEAAMLARAHAARGTVDRWLEHATAVRDHDPGSARSTVLAARLEITERCREILRTCAELTGSRPIAVGAAAARARADLDLLLLQHRLTPAAVRRGHDLLAPE